MQVRHYGQVFTETRALHDWVIALVSAVIGLTVQK